MAGRPFTGPAPVSDPAGRSDPRPGHGSPDLPVQSFFAADASTQTTENTKYQWVTFKTFRKAVATLIANEHDIRTAQHQLGHASASTTERFYDAGAPDAPRVAETLQRFLEQSEPPRT
jgi:integrase